MLETAGAIAAIAALIIVPLFVAAFQFRSSKEYRGGRH